MEKNGNRNINQLTVIDEYTRHKYMELAMVVTVNWLTYMGYTAIIIIALYFTYRIGIFNMMKNCLPTKLCLLSIKTKVEAPTHVVTYHITLQYNPCSQMMYLKTDELRYKILGFEDKSNSKRGGCYEY